MSEIKVKYPIVISFNAGATINTGNFQSIRVNVGLSVPVYDSKNVDIMYEKVIKKVEKVLEKKIEEYTKTMGAKIDENIILEEL